MALFPTQHTLTQGCQTIVQATLGYRKRNTYGVETCILLYHFRYFMPWYGVNRVMKRTNQCLNCESTL